MHDMRVYILVERVFVVFAVFVFLCILFTPLQVFCSSWSDMLDIYRVPMGESTYKIIKKQYDGFLQGSAPAIADTCIKQISIVENNEPLVDLSHINNPRLSVMSESELLLAHESLDDIDSRSARYSLMRRGVFEALLRMVDEIDTLAPLFGYEAGALEIRLFEGLRDIATQKELFDNKMAELAKVNISLSETELYMETAKWVSPYINNVPAHSTGAAIDIHVWNNKTGSFLSMGRFNVGGVLAPMFSANSILTKQQQENRLLLLIAATRAGLINYVYEFWHFSLGDCYATYWYTEFSDQYCAQYGIVDV